MANYVQRKTEEVVKASSGMDYDFRRSEWIVCGHKDAHFFRASGYKVVMNVAESPNHAELEAACAEEKARKAALKPESYSQPLEEQREAAGKTRLGKKSK